MEGSKIKLLHVLDILNLTDEAHPLTANQIAVKLKAYDIDAERRSICRDITTLCDAGYDIQLSQDNKLGYFMASRNFEDWELKVMIDAVLGAKFLTAAATERIIEKITSLTGDDSRKTLNRITLFDASSSRGRNPSVSINIDTVLKAIRQGRKISFQYTSTEADMSTVLRKSGKKYMISPYSLIWHNERYYMIGNYAKYDNLGAYRLDRMKNASVSDEPIRTARELLGANADLKIMEYVRESMYEYGGEKIHVTLEFDKSNIDDIADNFGRNIKIKSEGDKCRTTVEVLDGDGLYFWLLQYGLHVKAVSPDSVVKEMKKRLKTMLKNYR
jgi:predicted DNA-binding transcriptional regulator YafY